MKLGIIGAVCVLALCTTGGMNHEAGYAFFTELVDVPMAAMLVPATSPAPTTTAQTAPEATPGMLQALHDFLNKRPARTN
jgi:hypothetical protein